MDLKKEERVLYFFKKNKQQKRSHKRRILGKIYENQFGTTRFHLSKFIDSIYGVNKWIYCVLNNKQIAYKFLFI